MLLKLGSKGQEVENAQKRLIETGYFNGNVDGLFGATTEEAVLLFQSAHELEADGVLTMAQLELLYSDSVVLNNDITSGNAIDEAEMLEMLSYITAILGEADEDAQRQIIGAALFKFGARFIFILGEFQKNVDENGQIIAERLIELTNDVLLKWLSGDSLTEQADEDERRAIVALDVVDKVGLLGIRLAAKSLLLLPKDHPLRISNEFQEKLLELARQWRKDDKTEDYVLIAETLLSPDLLTELQAIPIIEELFRIISEVPEESELRRKALVLIASWHVYQAIYLRELNPEGAAHHRTELTEVMDKIQAISSGSDYILMQAINLDESGRRKESADLLAFLCDGEGIAHEVACGWEGMMRVDLGDYDRATSLLERIVPTDEERYLLAYTEDEIQSLGKRYSQNAVNLAFAYAYLDRWDDALRTLDRTKSARLQHRIKLRQSPEGPKYLELEAKLATAIRGVPDANSDGIDKDKDPLGYRLSSAVRALELYRNERPDLGAIRLIPPTVAEIGATLSRDEAVVSLGSGFKGLMITVVLPGDSERPSGTFILEELDSSNTIKLMFNSDKVSDLSDFSGWALELISFQPVDPEPALLTFLARVDEAFGNRIAAFLGDHDIHRVTIIPHRTLHIIPFWALSSLEGMDVRTASSLAQWYHARERVGTFTKRVTSVGNPTLDLSLTTAEAESVKALLSVRGCETDVLLESDASEDRILNSISQSGLLHFAGHGMARPTEPLLSSLLTHPDEKWGWPVSGDPLAALSKYVNEWHTTTNNSLRYADLNEGRLIEMLDENGEIYQRRLEHATTGTLWGQYESNQWLQIAELWTVGDILIEDAFANCSVVYLGACESGRTAFNPDVDENIGLPSALQVAGVDTVICTLWPVGDIVAFLFSRLFYSCLIAQQKGIINLADIVARCRGDLACLHKNEAINMLRETSMQLENYVARAEIEYAIEDITQGPEEPFAHPYHWAAFFTQGVERVFIPWD